MDHWKVNQQTTNGTIRYWDMIETMLAALWTMPNSGDGLTLGVPVTHGGTGNGGLGNNNAWVRLQDPGGGREIIIQRKTSSDSLWDFVYSPSAKFTGGSPTQTVRPTATDEGLIINGANVHPTTNSLHHCWASDVAPYPFYLFAYPIVGGNYNHLTLMDEVEVQGTDLDNVVFVRGTSALSNLFFNAVGPLPSTGTLAAFGMSSGSLVHLNLFSLVGVSSNTLFRGFYNTAVPPVQGSTDDMIGPAFFYRPPGVAGEIFKGRAKNFKLAGFDRASSGITYTVTNPRDRIYMRTSDGCAVLPWDGVIPTFP